MFTIKFLAAQAKNGLWIFMIITSCQLSVVYGQVKKIEPSCPLTFEIHKNGDKQILRYAANHPLNKADTNINTLLIYIHGIYRDGAAYFQYADDMIGSVKQKKQVLLIAPQYADKEDIEAHQLSNLYLYWIKATWKDGDNSVSDEGQSFIPKLSSYEVLDSMVSRVISSNKFPGLKKVVIAGHSAGGQFVQRYSAITPIPDNFKQISFRFVAMDPSSYMYLDGKRPSAGNSYVIADSSECPNYNHYPKGLEHLNGYAKRTGKSQIRYNMLNRDIVILLGEKDTRTDDPNLDVTCAANMQGRFRLERGINYIGYLKTLPDFKYKTNYEIVKGSGHNGNTMINSPEAKKWILNIR